MRQIILIAVLLISYAVIGFSQYNTPSDSFKKQGVVWSAGLFKSWLNDSYVGFSKIGDQVSPVFYEQHKMGFALQSHYMYKPSKWFGIGGHLGLGLDVNSNIKAPVVLFGVSLSIGKDNDLIIDIGLADGKRKIIPEGIKNEILKGNYTVIPEIYDHTELNTGWYLALTYKIF